MIDAAEIQQVRDNLFLILLPTPIPGFDYFIGSWVHMANPVAVIDVGPAVTTPALLEALAAIGVRQPEMILLSHIHIDHAGGIGPIAAAFPKTPVVCHPKAVPHLINPERLWQGSLKTLGDTARAYGRISSVDSGQVLPSDKLESSSIVCVDTPGHAAHHISFMMDKLLFAGEAGGVCLPLVDQTLYLRPATPPRFFLETSLESLDRMLALNPRQICYGHVGWRTRATQMLQAHRDQLLLWKEWIQPFRDDTSLSDPSAAMRACRRYLISKDPLLSGLAQLSAPVQVRERNFLLNSIKGYWDYL